jgi:sulfite dehydrogenase (quinone) subunit SoeC
VNVEIKTTTCYMCACRCGIRVHLRDGAVRYIEGNPTHPINKGVKHPRVVQIAQGAMGGSFNTREFFHGRPREVVRAARWTFLALVFPVPGVLLILRPESAPALTFAVLIQFAGLLAERWYFFAEANHPQNLYYQAIS